MSDAVFNDSGSLRRAVLGDDGVRAVRCYHCGERIEIAPRARSVSCSLCHQQLNTVDIVVRAMHWGTSLRTAGSVVIHRRARAVCHEIVASVGVQVFGTVEADIRSGGVVVLGPEASLKGSVHAAKLIVDPGALVTGGMVCVPAGFGESVVRAGDCAVAG